MEKTFAALADVVTTPVLVYWVVVLAVALAVVLRVSGWVGRTLAVREQLWLTRKSHDPVPTENADGGPPRGEDRGLDSIARQFTVLKRLLYPGIFGITLFALALPLLPKVPATVLSLVVGAVTVIVGIAAKPFTENAISGVLLSLSRTMNVGDTVDVDGEYGTIEDIRITHTTVKLWDWRRYLIPNASMIQSRVTNYSLVDRYQWAYVEVWVDYSVDLAELREIVIGAGRESAYFAGHVEEGIEDPVLWVMELEPHGVRCWAAAWARTPSDAWGLKNDLRTAVATALHARGLATHQYRFGEPGQRSGEVPARYPSVASSGQRTALVIPSAH